MALCSFAECNAAEGAKPVQQRRETCVHVNRRTKLRCCRFCADGGKTLLSPSCCVFVGWWWVMAAWCKLCGVCVVCVCLCVLANTPTWKRGTKTGCCICCPSRKCPAPQFFSPSNLFLSTLWTNLSVLADSSRQLLHFLFSPFPSSLQALPGQSIIILQGSCNAEISGQNSHFDSQNVFFF